MVSLKHELPSGFLYAEPRTLVVSPKRKRVWAVLVDLLLEFDRVCRENGLRYFAEGGTLLGAARHHGFIPWDDDMDVSMCRADYNKLCEIAPTAFSSPYFFQTNATDPGSARGHAQLRNSDTAAFLKSEMNGGKPLWRFNQGIFLDIFPFDNIPDDEEEKQSFFAEINRVKNEIWHWRMVHLMSRISNIGGVRSFLKYLRAKYDSIVEKMHDCDMVGVSCSKLERISQRYVNTRTKFRAPITLNPYHREVLPSYLFEEKPSALQFEFFEIPVYGRYEVALQINYGKNWAEHVIGVNDHGGMVIDVERSYREYFCDNIA